ncbi:MAG: tetratricopeptide repeat protein [Candidatus Cloacimonetes bacterium]|nr:tetratricopeptide repeat protein [Candidatus Cloacimonadota bacterium]
MKFKLLLLLALLFIISGCVYYNTFFNAEKYFADAQEMELDDDGRPKSNAIQKYNKVIKKCGIVLEYYEGSKYTDDALLLMARSFFYIGRNYTQTISTLEDMIKFYPESELVPDAKLYIARAKYEFRREEEAYDLLHNFLLDVDLKEHHPKALQILADYKLRENDNVQTDYYLNRIIEEYPDSDEYEDAFFLQGKSQNEASNYEKSNEIFFKLLKSKVTRKTKFDAKYYIALNYLLLEEYQQAADYATKLLKDEYRENRISRIRLIQARSYAELDKINDALAILEAITEDNKRSSLSASAFYFLGEIYFDKLKEYSTAIENYEKVRTEERDSEYVEDAISQSVIASQIIQYYNPTSKISAEELINQQFKLAEFYIEYLEMPDSALIVYNDIIHQEDKFRIALDTLQIQLDSILIVIDSLEIADSLHQTTMNDSIKLDEKEEMETYKINLQAEYDSINLLFENAKENILLYQKEFVPFAKFTKLWLYKKVLFDSVEVDSIYNELLTVYPDNKYTYAAEQFLAGKDSIVITTKQYINETAEYSNAIDKLETHPEQTIESLKPIANNTNHEYRYKALYGLGYINYFLLADSLSAKPYFDSVLAYPENSEFITEVSKFYNGENFIRISRLPFIEQMIQDKLEKENSEQEQENAKKEKEEELKKPEKSPEKKEEPENISPVKGKE